jgi:hypothetical protein
MKVICPHCKETAELPNEAYSETVSCPLCGKNFQPSKEIAKTFPSLDQLLKTPAFAESLKNDIAKANAGITHDEFVTGVQNKTIGFKVMQGEPHRLIKGFGKLFFNFLVMLYTIAPLFIIPLWAYHEQNWWLLIGIIVCLISTQLEQLKPYFAGSFFFCATIGFWFLKGIHNYFTFFSLCAFWSCMFFRLAEDTQKSHAIKTLVENPELFEEAVVQNRIMIVRKND